MSNTSSKLAFNADLIRARSVQINALRDSMHRVESALSQLTIKRLKLLNRVSLEQSALSFASQGEFPGTDPRAELIEMYPEYDIDELYAEVLRLYREAGAK